MAKIAKGPGWELRLGRYQDVFIDYEVDAIITDPPYSNMTHKGHKGGVTLASGKRSYMRASGQPDYAYNRQEITYEYWEGRDVAEFVTFWATRNKGWFVCATDDQLALIYRQLFGDEGLTTFASLPFVAKGSRVRMAGDGPSCWTVWLAVARPKALHKWGTLGGAYILPPGYAESRSNRMIGGKPLWLMQSLVRDYTRPGDLVAYPCAGAGTTLLAAVIEGRRAIGAEVDPKTFEIAVERLRKGYTPSLFTESPDDQIDLIDDSWFE